MGKTIKFCKKKGLCFGANSQKVQYKSLNCLIAEIPIISLHDSLTNFIHFLKCIAIRTECIVLVIPFNNDLNTTSGTFRHSRQYISRE